MDWTTRILPADPRADRIPCPGRFGRYRVDSLISSGGMGSVYSVFDTTLEMPLALKVLKPKLQSDLEAIDLFWKEARLLPRLNHPNLCRVYDAGVQGGIPYITMSHIEGGGRLEGGYCPTPEAAARVVAAAARAVGALHGLGFIHRDLKPGNILIDTKGEPVVIDFGIILDVSGRSARTYNDPIRGTPFYMAPEQARGETTDMGPWSDVYSLGIVLYELLAGLKPFSGSQLEVMKAHADPDLQADPPTAHVPGLSPRLVAVCMKAIAKGPKHRYPTMETFADALTAALVASPPPVPPRGWLDRFRRKPPTPTTDPGSPRGALGRVSRDRVQFVFVGHGEVAPPDIAGQDRLYLDVGSRLDPGVIDHHQDETAGSTCSLVLANPDLVRGALRANRSYDDLFLITLHREPDIDALAASLVAMGILCDGQPPRGSAALAAYVDAIDLGRPGLSLDHPYSAYAAIMQVAHRLSLMNFSTWDEIWSEWAKTGLKILEFALRESVRQGKPLAEVDAFDCPGLFRKPDRTEVTTDIGRYQAKLADPETRARAGTLWLPTFAGQQLTQTQVLFVRNVQDAKDPDRCMFFKEWARTDRQRATKSAGFVGLCVIEDGPTPGTARGILSVRPNSGVTLLGLGEKLEAAEARHRAARSGRDDRNFDPVHGKPRPLRPGYTTADPWYDGRAHGYTIIDAPRAGSALSADEIEAVFLEFGMARPEELVPLSVAPWISTSTDQGR